MAASTRKVKTDARKVETDACKLDGDVRKIEKIERLYIHDGAVALANHATQKNHRYTQMAHRLSSPRNICCIMGCLAPLFTISEREKLTPVVVDSAVCIVFI